MKVVAVTGGIGSGKSVACEFFEHLGIPIYYSDFEAKRLMNGCVQLRDKLIDTFSSECYCPQTGRINSKFLAKEVFSNKEKLALLNSIVHPAILADFRSWTYSHNTPYVIMESAILLDIGWRKNVDIVISVVCDEQIRIDRVIKRDGVTADMVEARIRNQMTDLQRISLSDYVVKCNDCELIIPQILLIDNILRKR